MYYVKEPNLRDPTNFSFQKNFVENIMASITSVSNTRFFWKLKGVGGANGAK